MKRLSDIDPDVIRVAIEIVTEKAVPPATDPQSLSTELGRLTVAHQSGRYQVLIDLIKALKPEPKPRPNGRPV